MIRKKETLEGPEQPSKKEAFKYMQDGKILNFQFVSEKRVKCPQCKKEYKNILLHLQKSTCRISDLDDLREKFKEHTKVHFQQEMKEDQRTWKANSRAKQRKVDYQKVVDKQNKWNRKSTLKQREVDNQKVLTDQNKRKIKSRVDQREDDTQ